MSINSQANNSFVCALLGAAVFILFFWSVPVAGQSSDENLAVEHTKVTASAVGAKRFEIVSPRQSGITFTNQLTGLEYYKNMVAHNGAGVAVGDVNGDDLADVFLCNIQGNNALYLNQGNFRFKPIKAVEGLGTI